MWSVSVELSSWDRPRNSFTLRSCLYSDTTRYKFRPPDLFHTHFFHTHFVLIKGFREPCRIDTSQEKSYSMISSFSLMVRLELLRQPQ
jgi:hypothetical protein